MFDPTDPAAPAQRVFRYAALIDLSVISLLIDKGVLTPDELIGRIESLYNKMQSFQVDGVMQLAEAILVELRARPGSTA